MADNWVLACTYDELKQKKKLAVELHGELVAIILKDEKIFACSGLCPHRGAPMSDAHIIEGDIVCSWHRSAFCLSSGECKGGPIKKTGRGIKIYEVTVKDNDLYVAL